MACSAFDVMNTKKLFEASFPGELRKANQKEQLPGTNVYNKSQDFFL